MTMPGRATSEVTKGQELRAWTYKVTRGDLVAYAHASGDQNPLHQNEEFAKSVGLPDVIAHGMHTMAKIGQFVTDWAGDPSVVSRFRTRFTNIVLVSESEGNEVTITGSVRAVDGDRAVLDLVAYTPDGTKVATADAEVRLR
jgi:acyl dehydratase